MDKLYQAKFEGNLGPILTSFLKNIGFATFCGKAKRN